MSVAPATRANDNTDRSPARTMLAGTMSRDSRKRPGFAGEGSRAEESLGVSVIAGLLPPNPGRPGRALLFCSGRIVGVRSPSRGAADVPGQRYPKVHPDGRADHRTPLPHRQRPRAPRPQRHESLQRLSESAVTALLYEHTAANIAEAKFRLERGVDAPRSRLPSARRPSGLRGPIGSAP